MNTHAWISRACLAAALPVVMSGCGSSLVGTWNADAPPEGKGFHIKQVQFKDDGAYEASARVGDKNQRLRGKYEFNGFKLILHAAGKPDREYGAMVWMLNTLKLDHEGKQTTLTKQ